MPVPPIQQPLPRIGATSMASADSRPEWVPGNSSNLDAVMYDPDSRVLSIRFQNGAEYQYNNVEPEVARGLTQAASPGRFFDRNIRGHYDYS